MRSLGWFAGSFARVPVPPDALGPCIRVDGDTTCPDEFNRRVVAGTIVAEPACGPCSDCSEQANEGCAAASVTTYLDGKCTNDVEVVPAGSCSSQLALGMLLDAAPPACDPAPLSSGLADPMTFCCV